MNGEKNIIAEGLKDLPQNLSQRLEFPSRKLADNQHAFDLLSKFEKPDPSVYVNKALEGLIDIPLDPVNGIEESWLGNIKNKNILVLAGGGGEQGPALAALGAKVTVFDISTGQLRWDSDLAVKFGLDLRTVHGCYDFLPFSNQEFDLVINPLSNCFFSDLERCWLEVSRVLKLRGELICAFLSPMAWLFEEKSEELTLRYKVPFTTEHSLSDEEKARFVYPGVPMEFGHSFESQLGGLGQAGLWVKNFREKDWKGQRMIDRYFKSICHIRAQKMFSAQ